MSLFSITLVLFFIMDPIGNVSSFLTVLAPYDEKKRRYIVLREMGIALLMMLVFNFFGEFFFQFLQISETTVWLTSGVILFLIAIMIIFPSARNIRTKLPTEEPFIIPLAIPLISGPALLATIMLYAHLEPSTLVMLEAIVLAWLASLIILLFAPQVKRICGTGGLVAGERLMAMILILIAVQRFMDGVTSFIHDYHG
jgi:small neutral amino acid transporter SnatA (MarC family)